MDRPSSRLGRRSSASRRAVDAATRSPAPMDEIKRNRIGGLMLVRDWKDDKEGRPLPWPTGKRGDLSYMRHEVEAPHSPSRTALQFAPRASWCSQRRARRRCCRATSRRPCDRSPMGPGNAAPRERVLAKSQNDQQHACRNEFWNKGRFRNENSGEPGRIRTCDQQLRRLLLYPAELRALKEPAGF